MIVDINNPGEIGIVTDIRPQELPPNAFSMGSNVRFGARSASKFEGHLQVFGTPSVAPYWLLPVQTPSVAYWVYAGLTKVYVTDGSTHFNLTRQSGAVDVDYSATSDLNWNGGVIGGIPVINNGVDDPQMWTPVNTGQRLQSLTYDGSNTWADVNYKASVIRPYRDFLVALDVTKAGTRDTQLVKWSTSAVSGTVPSTWDENDDTEDAGEYALSQTGGDCIDQLVLRDINIIYKDDSIWAMAYIGGPDIFRFYQLFGDVGILSRRCVKEFDGRHFVVTAGDVIVHDGTRKESVISDRRRDELFTSIDSDGFQRVFVVPNYGKHEMWICYPSSGNSLPNKAMIWNWRNNTWGDRELPQSPHIGFGIINDAGAATTWDADTGTWDSDTTTWDAKTFTPTDRKLLMAATNLYEIDNTTQFDGVNFTANVERTGLHFDQPDKIKTCNGLWLRTRGTGDVSVSVGSEMIAGEGVAWQPAQTYTIGTNKKIGCRASGRYLAYKIESTGSGSWEILGAAFDLRLRGSN